MIKRAIRFGAQMRPGDFRDVEMVASLLAGGKFFHKGSVLRGLEPAL